MDRGGAVVAHYANVGEAAALARLEEFVEIAAEYDDGRNALGKTGTSRLSENYAWGEISARTAWHRIRSYMARSTKPDDGPVHNRMRMLTASVLTKHLMIDWRVGEAWFRECLTDWDPAANAMGWQWVAGSGPDATPFFRIFNPETQVDKFDPQDRYVSRWMDRGSADARNFFAAIPRSWGMAIEDRRPEPVVGLKEGRERALAAYKAMRD